MKIPGTTRDLITEKVEINKITLTLIDSAGIRITNNLVEKEGIKKTEEANKRIFYYYMDILS